MTMKELIEKGLRDALQPSLLVVVDESHLHAGHAGAREGGETHYRLNVVADVFAGKSRVERHRLVNDAVKPAFERGLHALAIKANAPGE
ncbi:BolA family protein [Salinarimonas soli]|uniref:BolA family transcriptional regulator n=1 Tax=Salinarimonas soli TaxID=1638099 RepID=A0A5B2VG33_9HYPH|nr:BolA family protein [Salinarimonas soli]KAA2237097.1 BolA family transcriptional regulator [Salinarimonas soli]